MVELKASGWTLLHDVAWPGRKYANIDHVAIGNGHVYVIDAKNWTGEVATAGGVLRQNGRSRAKQVAAVADAARAVADAVPGLLVDEVRPVLCLVRDDWFAERFGEVLVCSSHNLVAQLRTQPMPSESRSPQHVADIAKALQARGSVAHPLGAHAKPSAARPRHQNSKVGPAVAMATALTIVAVLLSQPAWFTSALQRGSEEFVSLISPTTTEPAPAETPPPAKDRKRNRQGRNAQK